MNIARIYLRVSTEEQDLTRQAEIELSTRAAGYYIAGVYREKASGARADRPELLRMIADLQPGEVDPIQIQPLDTFLKPDFVLYKGVEELDGQPVIWYVATQMGNVVGREPVSGSGPLAKITFRALRAGQFTLPIIYQKIVLRTGAQIPSTAQGCSVTFFEIDAGGVTFVPFTSAN